MVTQCLDNIEGAISALCCAKDITEIVSNASIQCDDSIIVTNDMQYNQLAVDFLNESANNIRSMSTNWPTDQRHVNSFANIPQKIDFAGDTGTPNVVVIRFVHMSEDGTVNLQLLQPAESADVNADILASSAQKT